MLSVLHQLENVALAYYIETTNSPGTASHQNERTCVLFFFIFQLRKSAKGQGEFYLYTGYMSK